MYKITIVRIETSKVNDREWKKIADSGNKEDDGPIYDYVDIEREKEIENEILKQITPDLDLIKVIKAINDI